MRAEISGHGGLLSCDQLAVFAVCFERRIGQTSYLPLLIVIASHASVDTVRLGVSIGIVSCSGSRNQADHYRPVPIPKINVLVARKE